MAEDGSGKVTTSCASGGDARNNVLLRRNKGFISFRHTGFIPFMMYRPPHILFIFVDGIGLGHPDSAHNPLAAAVYPSLERLAGGHAWSLEAPTMLEADHIFRPIDARLGVDGLPQSGTGQASLFTGVNCARLAGRHFGPYPHSTSRPVLARSNVFQEVAERFPEATEPVAFANAYPPRFFEYVQARQRWTVTTRCCLDAGVPVRDLNYLRSRQALSADLTGSAWRDMGLDVDPITEETAARRLHGLARHHQFTLFEYFLTDKAGHAQSVDQAVAVLRSLDRFFSGLLEVLDPSLDLLIVTSDHGNLEDLSTRAHTLNPVPLIAYGRGARQLAAVQDLTEVTPALLRLLAASAEADMAA